jgi:hypothetical protein
LQKLVRLSSLKDTPINYFSYHSRMAKFFDLSWSDKKCSHNKDCKCSLKLEGIHPLTHGLSYESKAQDKESQIAEVGAFVNANLSLNDDKQWVRIQRDPEQDYFRLKVRADSTVKILSSPPISETFSWPYPIHLGRPSYKVVHALKKADIRYLRKRFPFHSLTWADCQRWVWGDLPQHKVKVEVEGERSELDPYGPRRYRKVMVEEIPPLQWKIIRDWSSYHFALGKTNGRLHVLAAMEDLYPRKFADSVLQICRQAPPGGAREALVYAPEALNIMYQKMKILPQGVEVANFSLVQLRNMFLGSSNGINEGPSFSIPVPKCSSIHVSARGKKSDTFESDLMAILDFIRTGKEPPVWWNVTPKNENFFSFVKQMSDEDYSKWKAKLRVFIIPSSIYVLIEKLVCNLRMLKERGWVIQIGHKWSHGGADRLARCLGITRENCFKPLLFEGDVSNFDQSVIEYFINLYTSFNLSYYDPTSKDYPIFEMLNKFLLKNLIQRVTHLFGEIWGTVEGGVPSGIYNTSHLDSWVMALYYFLFCVWALHNAPLEHRERLEELLHDIVRFIVYGDDHSGNPGDDPLAQTYFGGGPFGKFMNDHFGVVIRDLKTNLPYCSKTYEGFVTEMGLTFLKHQTVLNPRARTGKQEDEGQCDFLPYRESKEFLVRALWGRETRQRDELDVMMSCIGHAYGTYGSNRDAYDRLSLLFEELLWVCDVEPGRVMSDIVKRISVNDMKKLRQIGITSDELMSGFPTWDTICAKNTLDWVYQDITNRPLEEVWDNSDWDMAMS